MKPALSEFHFEFRMNMQLWDIFFYWEAIEILPRLNITRNVRAFYEILMHISIIYDYMQLFEIKTALFEILTNLLIIVFNII